MGFDLIHPFGDARADDRARLLATIAFNAAKGADAQPLGPRDFLKVWEDPADTEARALAAAQAWAAAG